MNDLIKKYLERINDKKKVCPNPMVWNEFYNKFCDSNKIPKPLILSAWHNTTDDEKFKRFELQLNTIENLSSLNEAFMYLENLVDSDWHKR